MKLIKLTTIIFWILPTILFSKDLIVGIGGDIETFDHCCANFIQSHHALYAVYEPPVIHPTKKLSNGALIGDPTKLSGTVFESWKQHDDGLSYTVKIRKGLTLHNGKKIDAKLVKYMIDRNLNTPGGGAWLLKNIAFITKSPEIKSEYEIILKGDKPSPMVLQSFYMTSSSMVDPEIIKNNSNENDKWSTEWLKNNIAGGSGPYKIVKHVPDQEIIFEAWDKYHTPAKIKRMIWKIIPSAAQRAILLKNGNIHIAEGLGEEEFKMLGNADNVDIIKVPSGTLVYLGMNSSIAPFDDKNLRKAVSYAIDYNDIIKNVYNGDAKPLWGPLSTTSGFSIGKDETYSFNLNKAKTFLNKSKYKGEKVVISIDSSKADRELLSVRIQSHLRKAGINVEIERLTPAVYSEKKVGKKLQMTIDGMLAWIDDPNYSLSLTLECGVYGNYMDYCNKEVDQIIKNGWKEKDKTKRYEMFKRAQEIIVDDAPWAFLAQPNFKLAMSKDVGGYVHYTNEIPRYHNYFWKN